MEGPTLRCCWPLTGGGDCHATVMICCGSCFAPLCDEHVSELCCIDAGPLWRRVCGVADVHGLIREFAGRELTTQGAAALDPSGDAMA